MESGNFYKISASASSRSSRAEKLSYSKKDSFDSIEALGETFIKLYTIGDGSCFFHSLLECISATYQESESTKFKKNYAQKLRTELVDYFCEDSGKSKKIVYKEIMDSFFKDSDIKIISSSEDITKLELERKNDIFYAISSSSVRDYKLTGSSRIFADFPILISIGISERIDEYKTGKFLASNKSQQWQNILDLLSDSSEYVNGQIIVMVCKALKLNICICKPYKNNICIESFDVEKEQPTIILFHVGNNHYEAGGIKIDGKIQTIFYPHIKEDSKLIDKLNKYKLTKENVNICNENDIPIENDFEDLEI